jgi:hypothetical protein
MKQIQNGFVTLLTVCVLMAAPVFAMGGGDYELTWGTIDGGGGSCWLFVVCEAPHQTPHLLFKAK